MRVLTRGEKGALLVTMDAFSIRESLRTGWNTFKAHWALLLGVMLFTALVSVSPSLITGIIGNDNSGVVWIAQIFSWVLGVVVSIGQVRILLNLVDGAPAAFADLFSHYKLFFHMLLTQIIVGVIVVMGIILFIIPGIIFALRLQFATYALVDKKLNPFDAIGASWHMTKGSTLKLLLYAIISAVVALVGALALGVGLLLAIPTLLVAHMFVYRKLTQTVSNVA